jgi:UDP-N-acetylmuramate--alanine ligase
MSSLTSEQVSAALQASPGGTVHLVGAGGCGMSGLGHLLLDLGCRVTGSDLAENEEIHQLRARGASIYLGHAAAQVEAARPVLVIYSSAVRRDNPELQRAEQMQVPIVRRAVVLAALLHRQRGVCVAGMHGKTTTSALLSFALENLEAHPSFAVGARVPQLGRHARVSLEPNAFFVIEADESDGSLREFRPECALVLNVDEEHLDFYANLEAVCDEFGRFAGQTRGLLVFCADDPRLVELFRQRPGSVSYGFHPLARYRIAGFTPRADGSTFELWNQGVKLDDFQVRLLGEKNVSNAAGVVALLHELGFGASAIARAIADFAGAARRQEELFRDARFRVFDDYGHHPAEIETTLGLLKHLGGRRLLVAFQPHRFTRTLHLLAEFATCFRGTDRLWVTEVYAANESGITGVNGSRLAQAIRESGQPVEFIPDLESLRQTVRAALQPGDVVLFLGAGDITLAAHQLAAELNREPAAPSAASN